MIQNSNWNKIELRLPRLEDIPSYVNYWYRGPFHEIRSNYVNWDNFPKESDMEKGLRTKLESEEHKIKPLFYMVEFEGKTIGMHTLNEVTELSGDIHAHYFSWEFVGKGLGLISGIKSARKFFEHHSFQYLYARPPHGNPFSTKMMKKLPAVEFLGVELIKYAMTKPGTQGDCYRLSREKLPEVEKYIMNLRI